jgi:hypothetical protein
VWVKKDPEKDIYPLYPAPDTNINELMDILEADIISQIYDFSPFNVF